MQTPDIDLHSANHPITNPRPVEAGGKLHILTSGSSIEEKPVSLNIICIESVNFFFPSINHRMTRGSRIKFQSSGRQSLQEIVG